MPAMQNSKQPTVNLTGSDINIGGDIIGRDKIIQHIVIVGKFLDMAHIAEFLPSFGDLPQYQSIEEAFSKIIEEQQSEQTSQAIAFAGEIIGFALTEWKSSNPSKPVVFRSFIPFLAKIVFEQLKIRGFWEAIFEPWEHPLMHALDTYFPQVFWLKSTMGFQKTRKIGQERIGIVYHGEYRNPRSLVSSSPPAYVYVKTVTKKTPSTELMKIDFSRIPQEEMQTLLIGLILDLARIYLQVFEEQKFVNSLIDETKVNAYLRTDKD